MQVTSCRSIMRHILIFFSGSLFLSGVLLLLSMTSSAMMEEEDYPEEDDTTRFVVMQRDPKTGTISVTSFLPDQCTLDVRTATMLATFRPDILQTQGKTVTVRTLKEGATIKEEANDTEFVGATELQQSHPYFYSALTFLYRLGVYNSNDKETVHVSDYAADIASSEKDMTHSVFVITECFISTSERWLSNRIKGTFSAVFPQGEKKLEDYPDDLLSHEERLKKMPPDAAQQNTDKMKQHRQLQQFYRVMFMSLCSNTNSLVLNSGSLEKLFDIQFESNWLHTLYGVSVDECWTFNRALLHFKQASGAVITYLTGLLNNQKKGSEVLNFIHAHPVSAVICAQAMDNFMQDELKLYSQQHARMIKAESFASVTENEQRMSQISGQYPELHNSLKRSLAEQLSPEDYINLAIERGSIQLIYSLRYLGETLASFHGSLLPCQEAEESATKVLDFLNKSAGVGREQAKAAAEAFITLVEWPQLLTPVASICAGNAPQQGTLQKVVSLWLAHLGQGKFSSDTYSHIRHQVPILWALSQPLPEDVTDAELPAWHCHLESYIETQLPLLNTHDLPLQHATFVLSSRHAAQFSTSTSVPELETALTSLCQSIFQAFSQSTWN